MAIRTTPPFPLIELVQDHAEEAQTYCDHQTPQQERVEQVVEQETAKDPHENAVDHGNHARSREKDLPPGGAHAHTAMGSSIIVMHGKQKVIGELWGHLDVVVTNAVDTTGLENIFDR